MYRFRVFIQSVFIKDSISSPFFSITSSFILSPTFLSSIPIFLPCLEFIVILWCTNNITLVFFGPQAHAASKSINEIGEQQPTVRWVILNILQHSMNNISGLLYWTRRHLLIDFMQSLWKEEQKSIIFVWSTYHENFHRENCRLCTNHSINVAHAVKLYFFEAFICAIFDFMIYFWAKIIIKCFQKHRRRNSKRLPWRNEIRNVDFTILTKLESCTRTLHISV